jgi:hypothetical protein
MSLIKVFFVSALCYIFSFSTLAQTNPDKSETARVLASLDWIKELYEPGIRLESDSIYITEEFKKLLQDPSFRMKVFPENYSWEGCLKLLNAAEYKIAFWHLLNISNTSEENQKKVLTVLVTYDELFEMDKVMSSVLFTYGLVDPRISTLKNGIPEVKRPDLFENLRNEVKSINGYILGYRNLKEKAESGNK